MSLNDIFYFCVMTAPQVIDLNKNDRSRFREFLHNAFDTTYDILLDCFDSDNDGCIAREEWITAFQCLKG